MLTAQLDVPHVGAASIDNGQRCVDVFLMVDMHLTVGRRDNQVLVAEAPGDDAIGKVERVLGFCGNVLQSDGFAAACCGDQIASGRSLFDDVAEEETAATGAEGDLGAIRRPGQREDGSDGRFGEFRVAKRPLFTRRCTMLRNYYNDKSIKTRWVYLDIPHSNRTAATR